jgi:hypothetical protein
MGAGRKQERFTCAVEKERSMRLRKATLVAAASLSCWINGYVFAARPASPEFAAVAADSVLDHANTLADNRAPRFESRFVDDFSEQAQIARDARLHLAMAAPVLTSRQKEVAAAAGATFSSPSTEQAPSVWLMVGVILLLIGYQLRRKHKLLRPHRFSEL